MSGISTTTWLDRKKTSFEKLFLAIGASIVGAIAFIVAAVSGATAAVSPLMVASMLSIAAICGVTVTLALRGRVVWAARVYVVGLVVSTGFIAIYLQMNNAAPVFGYVVAVTVAAFLVGPRTAAALGAVSMPLIFLAAISTIVDGTISSVDFAVLVSCCLSMGSVTFIASLLAWQARKNFGFLRLRLAHNEELFQAVPSAAHQLGAAASEIFSMTEQQTQGTLRQASAIEETRQVLHSVSQASAEIVASARQALENAEITLRTNERVAENVHTLSEHTRDIRRISDLIKDVASKSDLLALNAALEGTRAGEAGRGFSLVAAQMQKLAENITNSVKEIKALTADIGQATNATQLSMEEATKLARATTSVSEQINLITQQQRTSVEQVTAAMDDIAVITNQVATGTNQTITSTEELRNLADKLAVVVEDFRTTSETLDA